MIGRLLLAFALALAPVAAAAQQPVPDSNPEALLRESGIVFPEQLGNFTRTRVYSLMQGQISASYLLRGTGPNGFIALDIFAVRSNRSLAEDFAGGERAIVSLNQNIQLVRELPALAGEPAMLGRLWSGEMAGQRVLTGMYMWRRGDWRIKIRATFAVAQGEARWAEVERLVDAFLAGLSPPPR